MQINYNLSKIDCFLRINAIYKKIMSKTFIHEIGRYSISSIESLGRITLFFCTGLLNIAVLPVQYRKIFEHIWFIGSKSVFVILLTSLFTGMVIGLQGYYSLVQFGSETTIGTAVALTIVRELGPVFTAIMLTARAGSAMAAEIGVMRISEQIDALKTMHIHPVRFLFTPRLIAAVVSFPLLTAIFDMVGIFGGYLSGSVMLGINKYVYIETVITSITMEDLFGGFFKSLVFAVVVTTISCYRGYYTHLFSGFGSKGVSLSTTNAVVQSCITVLIVDYIITYFLV